MWPDAHPEFHFSLSCQLLITQEVVKLFFRWPTFIGLATWSTSSTIHLPTASVTSEGDDLRVNVVYSNPEWLILLCIHFSLKLAYFREKFLTFHLTQMIQYFKAKCCYLRHTQPHKIEGLFHPRDGETLQAVHDIFDMHECSYCSALSLGEHCFVRFTYLLISQRHCEWMYDRIN